MRYRDISIRKKILLSNFLMILIPVICVCLILAALLLCFSFLTDSSSALLRNVLLNSSNYGPTLLIKSMNDEISESSTISPSLSHILHELEKTHIHIMIQDDHSTLYTTKQYTPKRIHAEFTKIAKTKHYDAPYIVWNQNGMAYSSTIKNKNGVFWHVSFTGSDSALPKNSFSSWKQTKLIIKLAIIIIGFIVILLIMFLGIRLTKRLARYILQPLAQLQTATTAIKNGDFSSAIRAQTHDEFGILCDNFEAMRQQLMASTIRQQQYEEQRKELLAGISHDLSTPLTSIQGYVDGLVDGVANTPEKQKHYIDIIQKKTKLMNDLVDSLFLLSKLSMGEEPITLQRINITTWLQSWYAQASQSEDELTLSLQCQGEDMFVQVDTTMFTRVLTNLCDNSRKYKKSDKVHITIRLKKEQQHCLLMFQDDGKGVKQSELVHLFERFYRGDPARSSKVKGNGLGLAITKHIITQLHGEIWASSAPNQGLCIMIRLPLAKEENR